MEFWVSIKEEDDRIALEQKLGKSLPEVKVEAVDRWDAVTEASEKWGIGKLIKMQDLFGVTSVKKVSRKTVREWRTW